jgi:hypothetical protein
MAGIRRSRGGIVITMDGDLQNDPADIPALVARLEEGYDIVSGWRRKRRDRLVSRRLPSVAANRLARFITGVRIHDQGCALKAYRGEILRSISLYSEFHRFIVPLTQTGGFRLTEVETHHRAREFGRSKYGLGRTLRVVADLVTLLLITRFRDRLLLWFAAFAALPVFLGLGAIAWTALAAVDPRTTSLMVPIGSAVVCLQGGLAIFGYGIAAERIRQLAPTRATPAGRVLAVVLGEPGTPPVPFLVSGGRAVPLEPPLEQST